MNVVVRWVFKNFCRIIRIAIYAIKKRETDREKEKGTATETERELSLRDLSLHTHIFRVRKIRVCIQFF